MERGNEGLGDKTVKRTDLQGLPDDHWASPPHSPSDASGTVPRSIDGLGRPPMSKRDPGVEKPRAATLVSEVGSQSKSGSSSSASKSTDVIDKRSTASGVPTLSTRYDEGEAASALTELSQKRLLCDKYETSYDYEQDHEDVEPGETMMQLAVNEREDSKSTALHESAANLVHGVGRCADKNWSGTADHPRPRMEDMVYSGANTFSARHGAQEYATRSELLEMRKGIGELVSGQRVLLVELVDKITAHMESQSSMFERVTVQLTGQEETLSAVLTVVREHERKLSDIIS